MGDHYHLLLSHLVRQSGEYVHFYKERGQIGDFLILDNSAHEFGTGTRTLQLIECLRLVPCNEVVLPDRLFFGEETISRSSKAFKQIKDQFPDIHTMGVPQGRTLLEWLDCLEGLLDLGVDTIGLSKDYEVWPEGLCRLVKFVVNQSHAGVDIHLLGWCQDSEQLLRIGQTKPNWVRGVDSAKPLVYARVGIEMVRQGKQPPYPHRSEDFFETFFIDEKLAMKNIEIFRSYAKGEI